MKRLPLTFVTLAALALPQATLAQTASPAPVAGSGPGFYVEGLLGLTVLDEATFDTDEVNGLDLDFDPKNQIGANFAVAAGASVPVSILKLRLEGELSARGNAVDEIEASNGDSFDTINSSAIAAFAAMVNAHADVYFLPNVALSAGAGIGYAAVNADISAEVNDDNINFIDDDSDTVVAYQLMTSIRYDLGPSTLSLGYRYFVTDDPKFEVAGSNSELSLDYDTEYTSHNVTFGWAYNF